MAVRSGTSIRMPLHGWTGPSQESPAAVLAVAGVSSTEGREISDGWTQLQGTAPDGKVESSVQQDPCCWSGCRVVLPDGTRVFPAHQDIEGREEQPAIEVHSEVVVLSQERASARATDEIHLTVDRPARWIIVLPRASHQGQPSHRISKCHELVDANFGILLSCFQEGDT